MSQLPICIGYIPCFFPFFGSRTHDHRRWGWGNTYLGTNTFDLCTTVFVFKLLSVFCIMFAFSLHQVSPLTPAFSSPEYRGNSPRCRLPNASAPIVCKPIGRIPRTSHRRDGNHHPLPAPDTRSGGTMQPGLRRDWLGERGSSRQTSSCRVLAHTLTKGPPVYVHGRKELRIYSSGPPPLC